MNLTTAADREMNLKIEYQVIELEQVIRYFVNGYKPQEGKITNYEHYLDTAKGKVVLRLFIETPVFPSQQSETKA